MASLNKCQYIGRHGDVCGKNCQASNIDSTRCSLHRGKISSLKCLACDKWTRSMSQLCTKCNNKNKQVYMTPFLLTNEEIEFILQRRTPSSDSD